MFLQEYEKLRVLGKGAFASVYKVRHADLGYVRALKVSHELIEGKDDKAWQTFLNECRMLLRIGNGAHPNIVRIYQPRLIENKAVVEMDYVEGQSLCDYIAREKFIPFDEFRRFAEQIVGALAYCHIDIYRFMMDADADNLESDPNDGRKFLIPPEREKELIKKYQVIHNDLHSNNIIRRDYDGQYILLDFGLSIQEEHCVKSSSRGDGAIEYTAPEKLDQNQISTQSDIYSLGILLYEMLTGRVPFPCEGNTLESAHAKVYMAHLNQTPPDILELRKQAFEETHPGETYKKDLPEGLPDIIMKCFAKNPKDRFENAKELKAVLEECIANSATHSFTEYSNEATSASFDNSTEQMQPFTASPDNNVNLVEAESLEPEKYPEASVATREENVADNFINSRHFSDFKSKNLLWIITGIVLVAYVCVNYLLAEYQYTLFDNEGHIVNTYTIYGRGGVFDFSYFLIPLFVCSWLISKWRNKIAIWINCVGYIVSLYLMWRVAAYCEYRNMAWCAMSITAVLWLLSIIKRSSKSR